ncbi:uncharacterized protein LOC131465209 [Solea solea]|uniref:uncharacterized protein LOC131465209 n=1 Tax=Solea solea TaxID=90069 RepID=UPI00272A5F93|nr:uncharacterized protein LOC131465209 [Solea solea]
MTLPGPTGMNVPSSANGNILNAETQDPAQHGNSQGPGPSSQPQHHVPPRPVFYLHAPPPFFQYQWPTPFSYDPFAGFLGMGYGMVMPPLLPTPYMEPPTYILPHPQIQAVDYRRLLHPQVHMPFQNPPFQNPNQPSRVRPPHTIPVRETVNSEVQTEPTHTNGGGYGGRSLFASSDSGRGTASNSSSSSPSSQKRASADTEQYSIPLDEEYFQVDGTVTSGAVNDPINVPHTTVAKPVKSSSGTQTSDKDVVGKENGPPCRSVHCNMWSVSSQDSMIPVCSSSQQENEVGKERRISIPDILMSWAGGTPQSTQTQLKMVEKVLPQDERKRISSQTELEHLKSSFLSPTKTHHDLSLADGTDANDKGLLSSKDSEALFKILKLPLAFSFVREDELMELDVSLRQGLPRREELNSLNTSLKLPGEQGNETNLHENSGTFSSEMVLNSCQTKTKMNESIWSVESLAPFIPSKEWLLQNGVVEPEVIVEMTEESDICRVLTQNVDPIVKAGKHRQRHRLSSSDTVPMSDSCVVFSTPAGKSPLTMPQMESDCLASEMEVLKLGQSSSPEENPFHSQTCLQSAHCSLTAVDVYEKRSSEPEANQSPNQESLILKRHQDKKPSSLDQEETTRSSGTEDETSSPNHPIVLNPLEIEVEDEAHGSKDASLRKEQLCVSVVEPMMAQVSPSKGQLVECGIQSTDLECFCKKIKDLNRKPNGGTSLKCSDAKKASRGKEEGICMNGQMQRNQKRWHQRRNRGTEKYSSHQEVFHGLYGKPGKPQEKYSSHQEVVHGLYGKPGKPQGGNGRNLQC